nr:DUF6291 domain-containing protein [Clostridia bacterium]
MEYRTEKFTFFVSYYQALNHLSDPKERLAFVDALLEYAFCGVIPEFNDGKLAAMFDLLKPNVDKTIRNIKNGLVNGRKGGAPEGNQNAKKRDDKTTIVLNSNKTDKDMEKDMEDG